MILCSAKKEEGEREGRAFADDLVAVLQISEKKKRRIQGKILVNSMLCYIGMTSMD